MDRDFRLSFADNRSTMKRVLMLSLFLPTGVAVAKAGQGEIAQVENPPPTQAVSANMLSLSVSGLSMQYENFLLPKHSLSLAGAASFRRNASGGDYSSYSYGLGVELRYWFRKRAIWSSIAGQTMIGPYVGARFDLTHLRVKDELENRRIGGALTIAESLTLGYRFLIKERVEVTPSVEFSARTETDTSGRLGAWTRYAFGVGLSAGYLF